MQAEFDPKKRYTYDKAQKAFIVAIPLDYYRDLYNEWDYSPVRKRDLDDDLHDYLLDCAGEIPLGSGLIIHFYLPRKVYDPEKERLSRIGFRNYFSYRLHKVETEKRRAWRHTLLYALFGLFFLLLAYFLQTLAENLLLLSILPEGLFIGGWVLFWEAFTIIFFKNSRHQRLIREYKWLSRGQINFYYLPEKELHG